MPLSLGNAITLENELERKYDNILVIGNGFDKNLGLPTGYDDFMNSPEFKKLTANKNSLAVYLSAKANSQNWVDIERELAFLSKGTGRNNQQFKDEYENLCDALTDYLTGLDYGLIDRKSAAIRLINQLNRSEHLLLINFNYTESIQHALVNPLRPGNHIRVHGSAKNRDIVFGVQDKADINHFFLRKAAAIGIFKEWLVGDFLRKADCPITFFGHSLGESDHSQFTPFFSGKNTTPSKVDIHYHKEHTRLDLLEQIEIMSSRNLHTFITTHEFEMVGP